MNAPCSRAPLTAPHVTTGGLCRWKAINKEGRHVGLDFYDLLIEGHYRKIVGAVALWVGVGWAIEIGGKAQARKEQST